ncbi:membrane-spanning 4-domains subfamily A member 4A-like [Trichechus manatus latirostris]|uniref:Membrane-spanning 4-domains subfamily A member 4A-like n=1 Tax=Trichechus manatus latirostris TaxID=127582 RepID=A0A2Y9RZH6_TRIMA|nr:membrane-spanning 4-domains subfamily A member 4A-like [Trichechus manatus latirostris]
MTNSLTSGSMQPSMKLKRVLRYLGFIVSGALSIAVGTTAERYLDQCSLGLNITSSVLAATGIIISALSMSIFSFNNNDCGFSQLQEMCAMIKSILMGKDGLVLILSALEFCTAVSLSAFGCKVTCCNSGGVVFIMPSNPHVSETTETAPFTGDSMPLEEQQKYLPENMS